MKYLYTIKKTSLFLGLLTSSLVAQNTVTVGGQINSITGSEGPRRELRDISNTVMDPAGGEAQRPGHETGLLTLLAGSDDPDISGIFFRELTLTGTVVATATGIGLYLSDDDLVIEASRSLIGIGTYEGGATRVEACRVIGVALPGATGASETALQKAAGSLRCTDAVIVQNLNQNTDDVMAVRALSLIGDASSKEEVTAAFTNDNHYDKTKIIAWATDYVVALSQRNQKVVAGEIITALEAVIAADTNLNHFSDHVAAVKASIPSIVVGVEYQRHNLMKKNAFYARAITGGLIEIEVLQQGNFTLEVRDVSGALLAREAGNTTGRYNFKSNTFSSGLYILGLHFNGESFSQTVAVQ